MSVDTADIAGTRVGFVGLGAMGVGMAANVAAAGYPLTVLGHRRREPVERLVGLGAPEAGSAAELGERSDAVILCVTTSETVESVVDGLLAGDHGELLVIDCGTSRPESTVALGERLATAGCALLDVPLGRSAAAAEAGTLNMMAGGSGADFARARPLLETMSENLFHLGPLGTGHRIKLLNNACSMGVAALVAEIATVTRAAGVDPALLRDVLLAGPNRSEFLEWMFAGIVDGDERRLDFSLANGAKDLGYFVDMARAVGVEARVPGAAREVVAKAVADGHGEAPVPALARVLDGR